MTCRCIDSHPRLSKTARKVLGIRRRVSVSFLGSGFVRCTWIRFGCTDLECIEGGE